jgi:hypothetical protein
VIAYSIYRILLTSVRSKKLTIVKIPGLTLEDAGLNSGLHGSQRLNNEVAPAKRERSEGACTLSWPAPLVSWRLGKL